MNRENLLRERFGPSPAAALPVITFSDELTLHTSGDEIRAIHFARGHTDSDSLIVFAKAKVAQTGTDFVNMNPSGFPAIDMDNDGTGGPQGEIAALSYIMDRLPDDVQVIPGHGNVASKAEVAKYLDVLKETTAAVQAGISQGQELGTVETRTCTGEMGVFEYAGHEDRRVSREAIWESLTGERRRGPWLEVGFGGSPV